MLIRISGDGIGGCSEVIAGLTEAGFLLSVLEKRDYVWEWGMDVEVTDDDAVFEYLSDLKNAMAHTDNRISSFSKMTITVEEKRKQVADEAYMKHVRQTAKGVGEKVYADIDHQVNKYGAQRVDGFGWLAILFEESGETAQAYLKKNYSEAIAEARQTIACWSRFITEVERERDGKAELEEQWYERAK